MVPLIPTALLLCVVQAINKQVIAGWRILTIHQNQTLPRLGVQLAKQGVPVQLLDQQPARFTAMFWSIFHPLVIMRVQVLMLLRTILQHLGKQLRVERIPHSLALPIQGGNTVRYPVPVRQVRPVNQINAHPERSTTRRSRFQRPRAMLGPLCRQRLNLALPHQPAARIITMKFRTLTLLRACLI